MRGGHQACLLEIEGLAYNKAYPTQDYHVVCKVYSNEFHSFVLEEELKFLAPNVGMAYVVDQLHVMYTSLDHDGLLLLCLL